MTFINNHVEPLDLAEDRSILDDKFVRGQEDLKLSISDLILVYLSSIGRPFVHDSLDARCPLLKLVVPIRQSTVKC